MDTPHDTATTMVGFSEAGAQRAEVAAVSVRAGGQGGAPPETGADANKSESPPASGAAAAGLPRVAGGESSEASGPPARQLPPSANPPSVPRSAENEKPASAAGTAAPSAEGEQPADTEESTRDSTGYTFVSSSGKLSPELIAEMQNMIKRSETADVDQSARHEEQLRLAKDREDQLQVLLSAANSSLEASKIAADKETTRLAAELKDRVARLTAELVAKKGELEQALTREGTKNELLDELSVLVADCHGDTMKAIGRARIGHGPASIPPVSGSAADADPRSPKRAGAAVEPESGPESGRGRRKGKSPHGDDEDSGGEDSGGEVSEQDGDGQRGAGPRDEDIDDEERPASGALPERWYEELQKGDVVDAEYTTDDEKNGYQWSQGTVVASNDGFVTITFKDGSTEKIDAANYERSYGVGIHFAPGKSKTKMGSLSNNQYKDCWVSKKHYSSYTQGLQRKQEPKSTKRRKKG
jgi:hypothetical protein